MNTSLGATANQFKYFLVGTPLVRVSRGALLAAWVYSIHIPAGYKTAVRVDVKPVSIAGLPCMSSAAGLTLSSQRV